MAVRQRRSSRANRDVDRGPHKTLRKRALAALALSPGQPCARCGQPMYVGQKLDLDHTDDRRGYLGLSHASCNRRAGQAVTTAILRARGGMTARQVTAMRTRQWQAAARRWLLSVAASPDHPSRSSATTPGSPTIDSL